MDFKVGDVFRTHAIPFIWEPEHHLTITGISDSTVRYYYESIGLLLCTTTCRELHDDNYLKSINQFEEAIKDGTISLIGETRIPSYNRLLLLDI